MRSEQERRLLFIIHRAWVESRLLCMAGRVDQARDLADALELVPGAILRPRAEDLAVIRFSLGDYQARHAGRCFDYVAILDGEEMPVPFA